MYAARRGTEFVSEFPAEMRIAIETPGECDLCERSAGKGWIFQIVPTALQSEFPNQFVDRVPFVRKHKMQIPFAAVQRFGDLRHVQSRIAELLSNVGACAKVQHFAGGSGWFITEKLQQYVAEELMSRLGDGAFRLFGEIPKLRESRAQELIDQLSESLPAGKRTGREIVSDLNSAKVSGGNHEEQLLDAVRGKFHAGRKSRVADSPFTRREQNGAAALLELRVASHLEYDIQSVPVMFPCLRLGAIDAQTADLKLAEAKALQIGVFE